MKRLAAGIGFIVCVSGCGVLDNALDGDSSCHAREDCPSDEVCIAPVSDVPVCGIPCTPDRRCEAGTCGGTDVCQDRIGVCCTAWDQPSMDCVAACPARPCGADELCDSDGRCQAKLCDSLDISCPVHFTCTGTGVRADEHGCTRTSCVIDIDCAGGHCIEGRCFAGEASCGVWLAVP